MKNSLISFSPSIKNITKDRVNFILAVIPVVIGIILYMFLGSWVYGTLMDQGRLLIESYISSGSLGEVVYWLVATIFTIVLYFLVNWTFVLIITILSSPFNDMLSSRIEKKLQGRELESLGSSFSYIAKNFLLTLVTEIKKVTFIIILSLVSFVFGYIPLLTPISIFISVMLLAIGFIDYSWSRHEVNFKDCLSDLRKNVVNYGIGGAFFFILISIPIVNLVVSPWATSYFTTLWIKNNEPRC